MRCLPCAKGGGSALAEPEGLSDCVIDILADTIKVFVDLVIRYPYDPQAILLEVCRSFSIILKGIRLKMLRTIELNNDLGACAIEIDYVAAYYLLTLKANLVIPEEVIPKVTLFLGHVPAQLPCIWNELLIMLPIHTTLLSIHAC